MFTAQENPHTDSQKLSMSAEMPSREVLRFCQVPPSLRDFPALERA